MSAPARRQIEYPWAGSVTCDVCGYRVDLVKSAWRCWHCEAEWPGARRLDQDRAPG